MFRAAFGTLPKSALRRRLQSQRSPPWHSLSTLASSPSFGSPISNDKHDREVALASSWKPESPFFASSASPRVWIFRRSSSSSTSSSSTSTSASTTPKQSDDAETESTFRERMSERRERISERGTQGAKSAKAMLQRYGPVFVGTYFTMYVGTLGGLFTGIQSGALDPAYLLSLTSGDGESTKSTVAIVVDVLQHYEWTQQYAPVVESNPHFANLAAAWIITKFTEPLRLGITFVIVPKLARYFGYVDEKVADADDVTKPAKTDSNST